MTARPQSARSHRPQPPAAPRPVSSARRQGSKDGRHAAPPSTVKTKVSSPRHAVSPKAERLRKFAALLDSKAGSIRAHERAVLESLELAVAEERTNQLRAEYNALSFRAEEMQQRLESLSHVQQNLALVPVSPDKALSKARGDGTSSPPSVSRGLDSLSASSPLTLSQQLGDNHPTVVLEHQRLAAEARLSSLEPEMLEAEQYGDTLEMMLFRLRDDHARMLAHIGNLRDEGLELSKRDTELRLLCKAGRGAEATAKMAKRETEAILHKNQALYGSKLRQRRHEIDTVMKKATEQDAE